MTVLPFSIISTSRTSWPIPRSPLVLGPDANFYGVTDGAQTANGGAIYDIDTAGTPTTLATYPFVHESLNAQRAAMVLPLPGGITLATTAAGGAYGYGSVFRLNADGSQTDLFDFADDANGAYPGSFIIGEDGQVYGTTAAGGANAAGTLYKVTLASGSESLGTLASFSLLSTVVSASNNTALGFAGIDLFDITAGQSAMDFASLPAATISGVTVGDDGDYYVSQVGPAGDGNGAVIEQAHPGGCGVSVSPVFPPGTAASHPPPR